MDEGDIKHKINLRNEHRLRLYALELQKATIGINCPPEVIIEIENIKQEIAKIESSLLSNQTLINEGEENEILQTIRITTRFNNEDTFINRLAIAEKVIIVGMTNSNLVDYLEEALAKKRALHNESSFWQLIEVVFLSESVLQLIDDELNRDILNKKDAVRQRITNAGQARRKVTRFFVRTQLPSRWRLYEYSFTPPFIGAMFEMLDGQVIIQIATIRPGFRTSDYLFLELSEPSHVMVYYKTAFEDMIKHSTNQDEVVLLGRPSRSGFVINHAKFRRSVLLPDPDNESWIPAIVALLWQENGEKVKPLLQIRTNENTTREVDMLSNISGYISMQDFHTQDNILSGDSEFYLPRDAYENALRRELREELGVDYEWNEIKLINELQFYYPDRENLYFYLCKVRLESDFPFHKILPGAKLSYWSFSDMLKVRKYQVLSGLKQFLETDKTHREHLGIAANVIADNLILHQEPSLAEKLFEFTMSTDSPQSLLDITQNAMKNVTTYYELHRKSRIILGFAGLQYREFFSSLLPAYAQMGVDGAVEYLEWLTKDKAANVALERLRRHYSNRISIRNVEIDI